MPSRSAAAKQASSKKSTAGKRNAQRRGEDVSAGLSRTATDIIGVCIAVASVALLVAVLTTTDAVLASGASWALFSLFGVGAYLVPVALFVWSMTFFLQHGEGRHARLGLGIALIVIAVLAIISCLTPGCAHSPLAVFADNNPQTRGGYLGAGIAWCLLTLLGQAISIIVLVGLGIIGAVVIGFSISGLVQRSHDALVNARNAHEGTVWRWPFARTRKFGQQDAGNDPCLGKDGQPFDDYEYDTDKTLSGVSPFDEPETVLTAQQQTQDLSDMPTVELSGRKRKPTKRKRGQTDAEADVGQGGDELPCAADSSGGEDAGLAAQADAQEESEQGQRPYRPPSMSLLRKTKASDLRASAKATQADLREVALKLEQALSSFHLPAEVVKWVAGPTFTLFHVKLPSGIKVSRILSLQDDIALALAAESVRIFAPVPGTSYVGIEIPNPRRADVLLGDVLGDVFGGVLEFAIGRNVEGATVTADLAKMPHLLIAGTTGSGKSVAINAILMSILMRQSPDNVRMILIDPKRVELSPYNGIPHLYVPVVSDTKDVVSALTWATIEMDRRFKVFQKAGTRKLSTFNELAKSGRLEDAEPMPYIVIVIDELSDLMMTAGKEVEAAIVRLAQLARAAGIHLVVATQRPASNVVTGAMKANITNRIAFKVATSVDSRVILDQSGAEKLIGRGDLLFLSGDAAEPDRVQGCFVSDEETAAVVEYLKSQGEPEYNNDILNSANVVSTGAAGSAPQGGDDVDPLLWEAAEIVVQTQLGSTSNIQRRLRVGYARAGRIMDQLEQHGIVGPPDGSRPREVMVSDALELESLKAMDAYESENGGSDG